MKNRVPARVSDDVGEEEAEAGHAVEEEACVVEDDIFISEAEDGFMVEEVAKRTSRPRKSLAWKLRQALGVVERASRGGRDVQVRDEMNSITCFKVSAASLFSIFLSIT